MPLKPPKSNRDIQSIHSAPKMRPTALKMAKNQGLDSVSQNKKNKNKKFREKAAEGHVGVYRDAPICKGRPFPAFRSATNTDVFITYAARLADGPTDWRHHRHRRPTGGKAGRRTSNQRHHQQRTSDHHRQRQGRPTDGKAHGPAARTGRKGYNYIILAIIIYNYI